MSEDSQCRIWITDSGITYGVLRIDSISFCNATDMEPASEYEQLVIISTLSEAAYNTALRGIDPLPHMTNYFLREDPATCVSGVRSYREVLRTDVYPGIDQRYSCEAGQLKYDFIIEPGAEPSNIKIIFQGVDIMKLSSSGDLYLHSDWLTLIDNAPQAWEICEGERIPVHCAFSIEDNGEIGFDVKGWKGEGQLIIDPFVEPVFSTYYGGSGDEYSYGITECGDGTYAIAGYTTSTDFPVLDPYQGSQGGGEYDIFVSWFDGDSLIRSSYIGGSGDDYARGIAADSSGAVYLVGWTNSSDFPVSNAIQPVISGEEDCFVLKLSPSGDQLEYSTYIGGSNSETARSVAVDSAGNAYVTGYTNSSDFPLEVPFQRNLHGSYDAFVLKMPPDGSELVYSTFFGGSNLEVGRGIAIDVSGNVYVLGETTSMNLPLKNPYQSQYGGGERDMFFSKFTPDGQRLLFSTYLGGNGDEYGLSVVTDSIGCSYVAGLTGSTDYPVLNAVQNKLGGAEDAAVTKFDSSGVQLVYSTYLGGAEDDRAVGICIDDMCRAFVTGSTLSSDFPLKNPYQGSYSGGFDTFVSGFSASGGEFVYSTYLGGSLHDYCIGIIVDSDGFTSVTGRTLSLDYPMENPVQSFNAGGWDAYITTLTPEGMGIPYGSNLPTNAPQLFASPNPFTNIVNLRVEAPESGEYFATVFDTSGRRLAHFSMGILSTGDNTYSWHSEPLPEGLYIVQVSNSRGEFSMTRVLHLGNDLFSTP